MSDADKDAVDELDMAIARAEGRVDGLIEARKIFETALLFRQVTAEVIKEQAPAALPADPPKKQKHKTAHGTALTDEEIARKVATVLFIDGPMSSYMVNKNKLHDISAFIIERVASKHPWFTIEGTKLTLTTEGHQAMKGGD